MSTTPARSRGCTMESRGWSISTKLSRLTRRFFFSSRRRHTRWNCDWSSDVCSSDLARARSGTSRSRARPRPAARPATPRAAGRGRSGGSSEARAGGGAGLPHAEEVHHETELVLVVVPVDVLGAHRPAAEAPIDADPILDRGPLEDVPGRGAPDVEVAQQSHHGLRAKVPGGGLLIEPRAHRDLKPRIGQPDVRVGLAQSEVIDIVPGVRTEADPLARLDREVCVGVSERPGPSVHLVRLASPTSRSGPS